jgi:hypothetical protein
MSIRNEESQIDEKDDLMTEIPLTKSTTPNKNNMNLLLNCVKTEDYCFTLLDYIKKMFRFSQIDYYSAYMQIIYCFRPKEM